MCAEHKKELRFAAALFYVESIAKAFAMHAPLKGQAGARLNIVWIDRHPKTSLAILAAIGNLAGEVCS